MQNLVERLDQNGVVEEYDGPWGALVFLAENHIKKNFHGTSTSGGFVCPTKK